ncbi:hypothetical protein B2J93_2458 [Marssonina coronariae]|uniref:Uncharacterized protein n=1 Tax=Diplocarpon coronariae TaxID=2795749 RepID=A0A218YT68_9HELO|nr:hypothetical protein B2J93_2458 [Marssonina coronariae]
MPDAKDYGTSRRRGSGRGAWRSSWTRSTLTSGRRGQGWMEGWRGGMEGWRDGGLEGWRVGGLDAWGGLHGGLFVWGGLDGRLDRGLDGGLDGGLEPVVKEHRGRSGSPAPTALRGAKDERKPTLADGPVLARSSEDTSKSPRDRHGLSAPLGLGGFPTFGHPSRNPDALGPTPRADNDPGLLLQSRSLAG